MRLEQSGLILEILELKELQAKPALLQTGYGLHRLLQWDSLANFENKNILF